MKNKIIDLFCGCGGLSRGFEMAGFETKIAIDMWEDAVKTYNHNRKCEIAVCEDIHNWDDAFLDKLISDGDVVGYFSVFNVYARYTVSGSCHNVMVVKS